MRNTNLAPSTYSLKRYCALLQIYSTTVSLLTALVLCSHVSNLYAQSNNSVANNHGPDPIASSSKEPHPISIEVQTGYTSNPAALNKAHMEEINGSGFLRVEPTIVFSRQKRTLSYYTGLKLNAQKFNNYIDDTIVSYQGDAGIATAGSKHKLDLYIGREKGNDIGSERTDGIEFSSFTWLEDKYGASINLGSRSSRLNTTVIMEQQRLNHDEKVFNRNTNLVDGLVRFNLSKRLTFNYDIQFRDIEFVQTNGDVATHSNKVSVDWEISNKLLAQLSLSNTQYRFDNAGSAYTSNQGVEVIASSSGTLTNHSQTGWGLNIDWRPRKRNHFGLKTSTTPKLSDTLFASSIMVENAELYWKHYWSQSVDSRLSFLNEETIYNDSSRKDDTDGYSLAVGYANGDHRLGLEYSYLERSSTNELNDYDRSLLLLSYKKNIN